MSKQYNPGCSPAEVAAFLREVRERSKGTLTLEQSVSLDRAIDHFDAQDQADILDAEQPD